MADPTTKVINADAHVHVDYKTDLARYQKLQELGKERAKELDAKVEDVAGRRYDLQLDVLKADEALTQATHAHDLHSKYVTSRERQLSELADQIDAAQKANDTQKVSDLEGQYNRETVEVEQARQQLGEFEQAQQSAQIAHDLHHQEYDGLTKELTDLKGQGEALKQAQEHFERTAEALETADRHQDLKDVAAGGDPAQIRQAVLAQADAASDRWHEVATEQAKVFEQFKAVENDLKTKQAELDISQREQAKLVQQVEAAEKAGRTDEVDSLSKELTWRTDRVNKLSDELLIRNGEDTDLKIKSDALHEKATALKKESEELRSDANAKPETLEAKYAQREAAAAKTAEDMRPQPDDENEVTAKRLESGEDLTPATTDEPDPSLDGDPGASLDADPGADIDAIGTEPSAVAQADPTAELDDLDGTASLNASADAEATASADAGATVAAPTIVDNAMLAEPAPATGPFAAVPYPNDANPEPDSVDVTYENDVDTSYQEPDPEPEYSSTATDDYQADEQSDVEVQDEYAAEPEPAP